MFMINYRIVDDFEELKNIVQKILIMTGIRLQVFFKYALVNMKKAVTTMKIHYGQMNSVKNCWITGLINYYAQ